MKRFLGLAILINITASVMTHVHPGRAVAIAAALDMTVTVMAVYWWFVIRPGIRPKASMFFVGAVGLLRASFVLPDAVPGRVWIGAGAECAAIAAIAAGFRGWVPFAAAERMLAGELSIFYYAFAWRARPEVPAGAKTFTMHRKSGIDSLILMVGLLSLIEVVPVHLIVATKSVMAAWVLTGLSLYGAVWAVAVGRSFALKPSLITDDEIIVRFGLLFSMRIPREAIVAVSSDRVAEATIVPRRSEPRMFLHFDRALEAEKMLGIRTRVTALGLAPDDDTVLRQL